MAIFLIAAPESIQPVYNPIYFGVSSNNIGQPNFQYIFNLYTGSTVTGQPISSIYLAPRPDTSALYNPARILESYVGTDMNMQTITALTASQSNFVNYSVDFGEYYSGTSHTGLTSALGLGAFNGVLQYQDIPTYDYTVNLIQDSFHYTTRRFLTNQPRDGVYVNAEFDMSGNPVQLDWGSVSYMSLYNEQPSFAKYNFYYDDGSSAGTSLFISGLTDNSIWHIPVGLQNLNIALGTGSTVINNSINYYTVQLLPFNAHFFCSEPLKYIVNQRCGKYQPVRIQFLNSLGGWDYVNFDLISKKTLNLNRTTFKKNLPYNYTVGTRETTIIDMKGSYNYEINTDWVSDAYSKWFEELFTSQQINIIRSDGTAIPVNMVETASEVQKTINQGLLQYTFNLESAFEINTQRG